MRRKLASWRRRKWCRGCSIEPADKTIARILKVNHAGEYGAIRIYRAQLFVIRLLFSDLTSPFSDILAHEVSHCRKFREAMPARQSRPCHAIWLWSCGGYVLGFVTALMGRNAIMACTEAVESAVHLHMNDQIRFLMGRDQPLKELIEAIKKEELEHLHYAEVKLRRNAFTGFLRACVMAATELVIWLSTQGDVSRMKREIAS